jgi:uncharacterized membrane protein
MDPMLLCAQITGLSLVAVSTAMLSRPRGMIVMVERLLENPPILFVFGLVQLVGGLMLVLTQNTTSGANLALVLSLVGWWLLIRGAMLMFMTPETLLSLADSIELPKYHFLSNIVSLLIGIYLTYIGFIHLLGLAPIGLRG